MSDQFIYLSVSVSVLFGLNPRNIIVSRRDSLKWTPNSDHGDRWEREREATRKGHRGRNIWERKTMSRKRRLFEGAFTAKVALDAVRGLKAVSELVAFTRFIRPRSR